MNFMRPVEDTQESLVQDFSLPVLGILTSTAIGDPTGIAAVVIPIIVREVIRRVINPLTSRGESKRLYQWAKQAAEGIAQRSNAGEEFRKDEFFNETPTNRSNFEEVVESTLKQVMDTTEEPKVTFMANLTENIHFDEDLDMDTYRQILKDIDELTYRQLCIIKMCKNANNVDLNNLGNPDITQNLRSILRDFFRLCDTSVITRNNPLMDRIHHLYRNDNSSALWADGGRHARIPGYDNQSENLPSELIFKFACLDKIPDEHIDKILQALKK